MGLVLSGYGMQGLRAYEAVGLIDGWAISSGVLTGLSTMLVRFTKGLPRLVCA